jgi:hypothetical protein
MKTEEFRELRQGVKELMKLVQRRNIEEQGPTCGSHQGKHAKCNLRDSISAG